MQTFRALLAAEARLLKPPSGAVQAGTAPLTYTVPVRNLRATPTARASSRPRLIPPIRSGCHLANTSSVPVRLLNPSRWAPGFMCRRNEGSGGPDWRSGPEACQSRNVATSKYRSPCSSVRRPAGTVIPCRFAAW
jgi:hypothetical protein